jgi:Uma2 family endonuclease
VTANDLGLVVEVAESSRAEDREVMARLYAACGIPAYWIINLVDRWVEVFTGPDPAAGDRMKAIFRPGEQIPVVLDGVEVGAISADDLLP